MASFEIFEAYEQEVKLIIQNFNEIINNLKLIDPNDKKKISQYYADFNGKHENCLEVIKLMDMEARTQSGENKITLTNKVNYYKNISKMTLTEFNNIKDKINHGNLVGDNNLVQESRVKNTEQKLSSQNEKISSAMRSIYEIEEVGVNIVDELSSNREKIESSRNHATTIKTDMDLADKKLKEMKNREKCSIC